MMVAQHTPGPWSIQSEESPLDYQMEHWVQAGTEDLCSLNSYEDARLVAAAPELLEALRMVMGCAGDINCAPDSLLEVALGDGDDETRKQANAFLVARAVLAKATGATSAPYNTEMAVAPPTVDCPVIGL